MTPGMKLVRDRVPALIRAAGDTPVIRVVDSDPEFRALLRSALIDVTTEYLASNDRRKLADMVAIIDAIADLDHINLRRILERRAAEFGSYGGRTVLEGYAGKSKDDPLSWLRGVSE